MKLPEELTTVTKVSKMVALIMFVSLPVLAFVFGMRFQETVSNNKKNVISPPPSVDVACTMDALICPDGTAVGRVPPNCEFEQCPGSGTMPGNDANPVQTFICPESGYVDCMPGPEPQRLECTTEYLRWASDNCPDFQGAAY